MNGDEDDHDDADEEQGCDETMDPKCAPPRTRLEDIIGPDDIKVHLDELLVPLGVPVSLYRRIWTGIRARQAPSVLLFGPPGTGKTELARAVAGEASAAFVTVRPSDILSKYVEESERSVRRVFTTATQLARRTESTCTVVFWDEIDALGQARNGSGGVEGTISSHDGGGCGRSILVELLLQFNQLHETFMEAAANETEDEASSSPPPRVIVLAATNRPEDCDPSLLRRFAMRLYVGLPTTRHRRQFLRHFLRDVEHCVSRHEVRRVARATAGWSGAELEHLTREAVMAPVRECLQAAAQYRRRRRRRTNDEDELESSSDEDGDDDDDDSERTTPTSNVTTTTTATTPEASLPIATAPNGSSSAAGSEDDDDEDVRMERARSSLLTNLEHLRPVNGADFQTALEFILGQTTPP